jgi:hypothetical protein
MIQHPETLEIYFRKMDIVIGKPGKKKIIFKIIKGTGACNEKSTD